MTLPTLPELEITVMAYYNFVDRKEYEHLLDLFADDIIYRRCSQVFNGKEALRNFYTQERDLLGKHRLENVLGENNVVVVEGRFEGTKNDSPFQVRFSDFFWFNANGRIKERHTYTDQGRV